MVVILLLTSALLAAIANFLMRKNAEKGGTSSAFLSLYFLLSLGLSFVLAPDLFHLRPSFLMIALGGMTGCLNFSMMILTAKSLHLGPASLTFTFQNASCILPGLLLGLLIGQPLGFSLTPWVFVGFILILCGLYLSTRSHGKEQTESLASSGKRAFRKWLFFVMAILLIQGITLSIFQWRVLLFGCSTTTHHWLIPWSCSAEEDIWFIPAFFAFPALLQLFLFWKKKQRKFSSFELLFGSSAGVLNAFGTLLLLLATKTQGSLQPTMLFPCFTIAVILFCNLWGMKLYKEKINWLGIFLCVLGVVAGLLT